MWTCVCDNALTRAGQRTKGTDIIFFAKCPSDSPKIGFQMFRSFSNIESVYGRHAFSKVAKMDKCSNDRCSGCFCTTSLRNVRLDAARTIYISDTQWEGTSLHHIKRVAKQKLCIEKPARGSYICTALSTVRSCMLTFSLK